MAFSKFDPHRPASGDALQASDPSAERRARFLKWANWIVLGFTMFGFFVLAWALWQG
ncbi:MAG: hypothetical protein ACYC2H_10965 [Thermoplasmatota archaeon]